MSLSEPPDIEQTIFSYLGLLIIDHALIKLSPIVLFFGQFLIKSVTFSEGVIFLFLPPPRLF